MVCLPMEWPESVVHTPPDMGYGTWGIGHGVWDIGMGHGVWDMGYGVYDMGHVRD